MVPRFLVGLKEMIVEFAPGDGTKFPLGDSFKIRGDGV
jgi:hypothetical protein